MPATCLPSRRWGTADASPRHRRGHYLGRALAGIAATRPGGRLGEDLCGFLAPVAALAAAAAEAEPGVGGAGFRRLSETINGDGESPPPEPPFACSSLVESGGEGGGTYYVDLGLDAGIVTLNFNAYSVPDRFTVSLGGVMLIDTGFRGEEGYEIPVVGPGAGSMSFSKPAGSPRFATVTVEAPLPGTAWDFSLSCPVAPP